MLKHEGGEGRTEPTTGNEIPLGSNAEEVADDIPAKLSEGEFVIPADVVRWFGVDKFYKMIEVAKQGYQAREETGQMDGGGDGEIPLDLADDDFEFEEVPDDYEPTDELEMALGGIVGSQLPPPIDTVTGTRGLSMPEDPVSSGALANIRNDEGLAGQIRGVSGTTRDSEGPVVRDETSATNPYIDEGATGHGGGLEGVTSEQPDIGTAAELGEAIGGTTTARGDVDHTDAMGNMAEKIGGIDIPDVAANVAIGPAIAAKMGLSILGAVVKGKTTAKIPGFVDVVSGLTGIDRAAVEKGEEDVGFGGGFGGVAGGLGVGENAVTAEVENAVEASPFGDMASVDTPDAPANDPDDGEAEGGQDGDSGGNEGNDGGGDDDSPGDDADGKAKGGFITKRKTKKSKSKGFIARKG